MYRGPAPIQHALLDGQKETGVCVIEMMEKKKGIDAGEIWGRRHMVSVAFCGYVLIIHRCKLSPYPKVQNFWHCGIL